MKSVHYTHHLLTTDTHTIDTESDDQERDGQIDHDTQHLTSS